MAEFCVSMIWKNTLLTSLAYSLINSIKMKSCVKFGGFVKELDKQAMLALGKPSHKWST
jgi:hypothetical protein